MEFYEGQLVGLAKWTGTGADVVPSLVLCGLGVFLLLMAIAAFRGILHRKQNSRAD